MEKIKFFLGIGNSVSTAEKLASTIGGIVGIFLIAWISFQFTGASGAALIVPSMGASAVLLFGVPHGQLSQPWALFGGHISSAIVGVTSYQLIPNIFVAAALAVGLAIGLMHVLRCLHPPGGATALAAVIGGSAINELGYWYLFNPVLLNVVIIFITAIVMNGFFPWRRYPLSLMRFSDAPATQDEKPSRYIEKTHIEQALADIDLVIDVNVDKLQQLFALTLEHAARPHFTPEQIILGHYYTNNKHGTDWTVRQIIDEVQSDDPKKDMVIYRIAEGHGVQTAESCTRAEFAKWARRELYDKLKEKN